MRLWQKKKKCSKKVIGKVHGGDLSSLRIYTFISRISEKTQYHKIGLLNFDSMPVYYFFFQVKTRIWLDVICIHHYTPLTTHLESDTKSYSATQPLRSDFQNFSENDIVEVKT